MVRGLSTLYCNVQPRVLKGSLATGSSLLPKVPSMVVWGTAAGELGSHCSTKCRENGDVLPGLRSYVAVHWFRVPVNGGTVPWTFPRDWRKNVDHGRESSQMCYQMMQRLKW